MFLSSRVHLTNPGLTIFNKIDRESQSMAAAVTVKAEPYLGEILPGLAGRVGTVGRQGVVAF